MLTWSGDGGNYQTNTYTSTATSIVLDSLVYSGAEKIAYKETNVTLTPDGTTKDIQLEPVPILLKGITVNLIKDITLPFDESDPEFFNKRLEPNMTFTIFSKDGTFEKEVTSDGLGNYEVELPFEGDYGIEITSAEYHPIMYKVIVDELVNEEVIAMVDKSLSIYNFAQSHMGYKPNNDNTSILEPNSTESRTFNWSKDIMDSGIKLLFLNYVIDGNTEELGELVTQEMKDLVNETYDYIDLFENNFFSSKSIVYVEDNNGAYEEGTLSFMYILNSPFQGFFGEATQNGVVVRAIFGIRKSVYDMYLNYPNTQFKAILLQEASASFGAFSELWIEEQGKESIWYRNTPIGRETYTEDSKKATLLYHWISNKMYRENTDAEGFHYPLLDTRIAKEFDIDRVKNFIQTHCLQDIKDKF